MPRGIPSKKNKVESAETPKRRGRPPGSKNSGKVAKVSVSTEGQKAKNPSATVKYKSVDTNHSIDIKERLGAVRDNIFALRDCPSQLEALNDQVEILQNLTEEFLGNSSKSEPVEDSEPQQMQVTSLPSLPSFIAPPFPAASGS